MSTITRELKNAVLLGLGVLSAGMGLKGFLFSSGFIDGGVTGVCMLMAKLVHAPLWVLLPAINLPFVVLGLRRMGRAFAVRSVLAIAGLALALAVVPYPDVTPDPFLSAAFGGLFVGAGIGLAMRGEGVLDGTEIAAMLLSKRYGMFKVGDVILVFNVGLFLLAMSTLGVNEALYSIVTYATAAKTLDFVLHGVDEHVAMTIVSPESEAITRRLTDDLGRGVTVYRAAGGKSGEERDVVYCVLTRLEIAKVRAAVRALDPSAFLVQHALSEVEGGVGARAAAH